MTGRRTQYDTAFKLEIDCQNGHRPRFNRRAWNNWDNAAMERFFLRLKMARVWQRDYANQMEASKKYCGLYRQFL